MDKLLDLENDGLNMAADERFLYIRCKRAMYKYDMSDMRLSAANEIFKKDGKARSFSLCEKYVFMTDFCDLYMLDKRDLHLLDILRLGENLSSDLGEVRFDARNAYISIRNGGMAVMDLNTKEISKTVIAETSSWDFCVANTRIYAGTVGGELIEIDTNNMRVLRKNKICSKNIYSVVYHNGIIYTVSQDTTIKAVDAADLNVIGEKKKAVKGMVRILGIRKDCVVIADGGISLWDKQTLNLVDRFDLPTGHFNKGALLHDDILFVSDYKSVFRRRLDT